MGQEVGGMRRRRWTDGLAVGIGKGRRQRAKGHLAELLAVCEDEVHVLVVGHKGANELPAVDGCDAHAVINEGQDLASLSSRLRGRQ